MFEKHLWKSDILSKDKKNVTLPQVFFEHFAGKNQLPGLSTNGTLVENELRMLYSLVLKNDVQNEMSTVVDN